MTELKIVGLGAKKTEARPLTEAEAKLKASVTENFKADINMALGRYIEYSKVAKSHGNQMAGRVMASDVAAAILPLLRTHTNLEVRVIMGSVIDAVEKMSKSVDEQIAKLATKN